MTGTCSAIDVAYHILNEMGEMSRLRLSMLVYHCQAWSLILDDAPMFEEPLEAWEDDVPVCPLLFSRLRDSFRADAGIFLQDGEAPRRLGEREAETVRAVLDAYGAYSGTELKERARGEVCCIIDAARKLGIPTGGAGIPIPLDLLADLYAARWAA